jgi:hypothetical protein
MQKAMPVETVWMGSDGVEVVDGKIERRGDLGRWRWIMPKVGAFCCIVPKTPAFARFLLPEADRNGADWEIERDRLRPRRTGDGDRANLRYPVSDARRTAAPPAP